MITTTRRLNDADSWWRRKHRVRFVFRSASLVALVLGYSAYHHFNQPSSPTTLRRTSTTIRRRLGEGGAPLPHTVRFSRTSQKYGNATDDSLCSEGSGNDDGVVAEPRWTLVAYVAGVLYTFFALAVSVDEFFVPALEEMSSARRLDLSPDVAGATLMAAGGSAPELFTAFFGTFTNSDVGFGTIVGSAVFNVLFVIGTCSLLSREVLRLTWWPLFRDCTYYVVSLLVLAVFVGVRSKGRIYVEEAAILLSMYVGYVTLMKYNRRLYKAVTGKELDLGDNEDDDEGDMVDPPHRPPLRRTKSFRWGGAFRLGVLELLREVNQSNNRHKFYEEEEDAVQTGGAGLVSGIAGDVHDTWRTVDKDRDGVITRSELTVLFDRLECPLRNSDQVDDVLRQLDLNDDGKIDEKEFTTWYLNSEQRIKDRIREVFDEFDDDVSDTIDRRELANMLRRLEPGYDEDESALAASLFDDMYQEGSREEITYKEFSDWYLNVVTNAHERHDHDGDNAHDMEGDDVEDRGVFANLAPPPLTVTNDDSEVRYNLFPFISWMVLLPLVFALTLTVPDVRVRRFRCGLWPYVAFLTSIAWIGVYSNFMVQWTRVIGRTVGVPDVVMGLTFLAAGTSVPDLLSSVSVARRGEGDMAVSSSVGSNIFDVLVGLPLPWLIYVLVKGDDAATGLSNEENKNGESGGGGRYVVIGSDGVLNSVIILLVMVVAIVVTIHFSGWKLTKSVGIVMFVLYFAFLAQSIWSELPFDNGSC